MITHSVFFKLKHLEGSREEVGFFKEVEKLRSIPNIMSFSYVDEISPKNEFRYGLVLTFDNQDDYEFYNNHPDHQRFVENIWISQVADFLEIDYELKDMG